jgi:hypothetical protein
LGDERKNCNENGDRGGQLHGENGNGLHGSTTNERMVVRTTEEGQRGKEKPGSTAAKRKKMGERIKETRVDESAL